MGLVQYLGIALRLDTVAGMGIGIGLRMGLGMGIGICGWDKG